MSKNVKCILLIDDDEPTNVLHQIELEEADVSEKIIAIDNAEEALKYLIDASGGKYTLPELIFLDINMPGMDGWGFLEEYEKLELQNKTEVILIMLTTSLNPDDQSKAESYEIVQGFLHKPLTAETAKRIIAKYF